MGNDAYDPIHSMHTRLVTQAEQLYGFHPLNFVVQ